MKVLLAILTYDKLLHFFVGFWMTFILSSIGSPGVVSFLLVLAVAVLRELLNSTGFSIGDIIFTIMPCVMLL